MKVSSKLDSAVIAEPHDKSIPFDDMAKYQWALIHNLEHQYKGKTVRGTNRKFEDDVWVGGEGSSEQGRIIWQSLFQCGQALMILIKVICFEMMSVKRMETTSLKARLFLLKKSIIPLIESKNLLAGNDGDFLLGLNNLTDEDYLVTLDALLVSTSSENSFISICHEISRFFSLINHIAVSVPLYEIRARLPWEKSGTSINAWAKRRATDLGSVFQAVEGYAPLPADTVMPLIEISLTLIDEHYDDFATIGPLLAAYVNARKYYDQNGDRSAEELLERYGPIFGHIVAAPDVSHIRLARERVGLVFIWLRKLLYLARGACVNVILLTTGLRNRDMRGLQVGACKPSGRVDMLFYLRAYIQKTKNFVLLPVPGQAAKAISLLEKIKFTQSSYLIDGAKQASIRDDTAPDDNESSNTESDVRLLVGGSLNDMVRDFAAHFNIPFINQSTGDPYSLHCYRTTVAGWLGAASNLSVLMVRRLFGHSNNVMPTVYLRNNPAFIEEKKAEKAHAARETSRQMALAALKGQLAGNKGEQLERGFKEHVRRIEADKKKSHSMSDAELVISFSELIEQRILNESVCGFMTPFGVRCMRNPSETSQPPCAKRSHRDKTKNIDLALLNLLSDIDPQNCIGTSCDQAMIGPWSETIKESLLWYAQLLRHQVDDEFTDDHFREHAVQFIRQYGPSIKKVFHIEVLPNGSVAQQKGDEEGN